MICSKQNSDVSVCVDWCFVAEPFLNVIVIVSFKVKTKHVSFAGFLHLSCCAISFFTRDVTSALVTRSSGSMNALMLNTRIFTSLEISIWFQHKRNAADTAAKITRWIHQTCGHSTYRYVTRVPWVSYDHCIIKVRVDQIHYCRHHQKPNTASHQAPTVKMKLWWRFDVSIKG